MAAGWRDSNAGIEVQPGILPNEVTVYYDGLLARSGADQVYIHYGFGLPDWRNVTTEKMEWTGKRWRKAITVDKQASFCFKDSAGNWDNNNGHNWSIR